MADQTGIVPCFKCGKNFPSFKLRNDHMKKCAGRVVGSMSEIKTVKDSRDIEQPPAAPKAVEPAADVSGDETVELPAALPSAGDTALPMPTKAWTKTKIEEAALERFGVDLDLRKNKDTLLEEFAALAEANPDK